jgi:hypothetical protein
MFATQRLVTQSALSTGLATPSPAWKTIPSWFVFSDQDLNIPVALRSFMAERAGARGVREIASASHALSVSRPDAVAEKSTRPPSRSIRLPGLGGGAAPPGCGRRIAGRRVFAP